MRFSLVWAAFSCLETFWQHAHALTWHQKGTITLGAYMASENSDNDIIGTIKVSGNIADVRYVGGSTFEIDFRDLNSDEQPMRARKSTIDKWIRRGNMRLTNATRYREIEREIDPVTGDTPTHHANGTEKSLVERELSNLERQGFVSPSQDDGTESDAGQAGSNGSTGSAPNGRKRVDPAITVTPVPVAQTQQMPMGGDQANVRDAPMAMSLEDDAAKPKMLPARTKSPQVIVYVLIMLMVSVIALAGGKALMTKVRDGSAMNAVQSMKQSNVSGSQHNANAEDSNANASNGNANGTTNAGTENASSDSGQQHVVRSDFDPETAVQSQPMADDTGRDTATKMFEYIRQLFANGDAQDLTNAVNLDGIATQLADAYANVAKGQQGLTDTETTTLRDYYKQAFVEDELDNASKNDIYGSIFGGRIRDVRVDSQDASKLYVVMESLGGDHQRVCFVTQSSDNGSSWIVSGIMDADGYVRQIMKADTSQYAQKTD